MSKPQVAVVPPLGIGLQDYDRHKTYNAQPDSVAPIFLDAMSVRERVFVDEQKCPIEREFDDDDPRSISWLLKTSLPADSTVPEELRSKTEPGHIAVAALRMVPPPHAEDEVEMDGGASGATGTLPLRPKPSTVNPENEPYFQLGRVAVLKEYRKFGWAKLLVKMALAYTAQNPDMARRSDEAEASAEAEGRGPGIAQWKGLVVAHAQKDVAPFYEKLDFVVDEGMGVWIEEGIEHVGMWRRLQVGEGDLTNPTPR